VLVQLIEPRLAWGLVRKPGVNIAEIVSVAGV